MNHFDNNKANLLFFAGNIASGKTTFVKKIMEEEDVLIDLDTLGRLHSNPNVLEDEINKMFFRAIDKLSNIIIDGNLMSISDRKKYIEFAVKKEYRIICVDYGPGDYNQLKHRIDNNPEVSKQTWINSYNFKKIKYQKPSKLENIDLIIKKY